MPNSWAAVLHKAVGSPSRLVQLAYGAKKAAAFVSETQKPCIARSLPRLNAVAANAKPSREAGWRR
jgi:hypothetical protein